LNNRKNETTQKSGRYILFKTVEYSWNQGRRIGCDKAEIMHVEETELSLSE